MRDIHCPKDVGMTNIFNGEDCEREQHFNNCYHCWASAISQSNQEYFKRKVLEQEPKTGHWIEITNRKETVVALRCSACEKSPKHAIRSDFCPNCGAKMESEG